MASALQNKTGLNGVNIQTLSAYTNDSTSNTEINVTLTVTGYNTITTGNNITNGTIIISPNQTYSVNATATGQSGDNGFTIDVNSIIITSISQLYNNQSSTN